MSPLVERMGLQIPRDFLASAYADPAKARDLYRAMCYALRVKMMLKEFKQLNQGT